MFRGMLYNSNNSIYYQLFVCAHRMVSSLFQFEPYRWAFLTGTTTAGQSGHGSNGNEELHYIS